MSNTTCYLLPTSSAYVVMEGEYLAAQAIHILISISTIIIVLAWRSFITKQLLNRNAITLMNYILLSFALHAVMIGGTQTHHIFYDFFFAKTECDYLFSNLNCLYVKVFTHCFTINLPLLFICLCIERTVATYSHQSYNDSSTIVFRLLPVFTSILSLAAAGFVFSVDADDTSNSASCLFHTLAAWTRVNVMYYVLVGVNLSAVVWMCVLYLQNRSITNTITPFTSRYQIKENLHITKAILICGSIQLIVTILHESSNLIRRGLVDYIDPLMYRELSVYFYLVPYANLFFVVTLYILLQRRLKNKKNAVSNDISARKENSAGGYFARYAW